MLFLHFDFQKLNKPVERSIICLICLFVLETEGSERFYSPEMETNEIERQQSRVQDTSQNQLRSHGSVSDDSERNEVISTQQMCKNISF